MIASSVVERLGWTLLHSVWQLTCIALLSAVVLWLLRGRSPHVRYLLTILTLPAMLAVPAGTYFWLPAAAPASGAVNSSDVHSVAGIDQVATSTNLRPPLIPAAGPISTPSPPDAAIRRSLPYAMDSEASALPPPAGAGTVAGSAAWMQAMRSTVEPLLPVLVAVWLAGVLLLTCRHLGGWWTVERLRRRGAVPPEPALGALVERLARQLGVRRPVQILDSLLVQGPAVIGWLRPVILLPLGLATRLPADQLQAILLHELAHVRRCDYLANALQIVAETLLFYHPGVWWVSRRMRLERECCADEVAAVACGSRVLYARALTALEEQRPRLAAWGVAASGSDLRRRVERVLGLHRPHPGHAARWLASLSASLLLAVVVSVPREEIGADEQAAAPVAERQDSSTDEPMPSPSQSAPEPAIPVGEAETSPSHAAPAAGKNRAFLDLLQEGLEYMAGGFIEAAFPPSAPIAREYSFQVVTDSDRPVAGAKVTLTGLGLPDGSSLGGFPEGLIPTASSDADGIMRIDLSGFHGSPLYTALSGRLRRGIQGLYFRVDHPAHPPLSTHVWVADRPAPGERKIVLADSRTVEIRARREGGDSLLGDLYPQLRGAEGNWSERDGVLSIRRLDLTSEKASRWLRVMHVPEQGPVLFSDVIDLKQHDGEPISIDAVLKPGVRVEGRLSDEVPRPVKQGKVIAAVHSGPDSYDTAFWGAVAEISPEGTFVLEPLPADEDVQLIALCDGWVSQSPTPAEVDAYVQTYGFALRRPYGLYHQTYGTRYPRLHRPSRGGTIVIPMERTSACEITVIDDNQGTPIPNAEVMLNPSPQHVFFRAGSFDLGTGWDSRTYARALLSTGEIPRDKGQAGKRSYKAVTDEKGVAVMSQLAGGWSRSSEGVQFPITVRHPDYLTRDGAFSADGPSITLKPGETGRITIRMPRR